MSFSPIVLFTYNRPLHTKRTLDALALNPEAKDSDLYIYCDGSKLENDAENLIKIKEVEDIIKNEDRFKTVHVTISKKNKGLAKSIIEGVTFVVNKHGKVIVLEDDIVTSKGFLKFMNDSLKLYEDNDKVMHISGYMYPNAINLPETFFFNVPLCWGWATWSSAWRHFNNDSVFLWNKLKSEKLFAKFNKFGSDYLSAQLAHNISGKLNTWFIKWHASVLLQNGFTLYPKQSLVQNIGFDNSGAHNGTHVEFNHKSLASNIEVKTIELVEEEKVSFIIQEFYKSLTKQKRSFNIKSIIKNGIKDVFLKIFPELKKLVRQTQNLSNAQTYLGNQTKVYPPSRLSNTIVGNYTYISENTVINNAIIGKFCSIGANFMAGRGLHPTNGVSTHPMFYSTAKQNGFTLVSENKVDEFKAINIGNDVFIGMNVTVLDGVTIGDGAIIGAGAVVSKNIPAYAIAVGNPIQIKKYRFDDETISRLLKIKWWEQPKENLQLVQKHFFEVDTFLKVLEEEYL